jgi:hypothetical protein
VNRPLTLYQIPSHEWGSSSPLVDLAIMHVQATGRGPVEIRLDVSAEANGPWRCLLLSASMSDRLSARRYYGVIDVDPRALPAQGGPGSIEWKWWVQPEDIEALEAARNPADAPVMLELHVNGIASTEAGVTAIDGSEQIELPLHQWNRLKESLGFSVPPSQQRLLSPMNLASPPWTGAVASLDKARARLTAGDSYHALQDVFDAFESVVSQPYRTENWMPLLEHVQEQKRDGVAALLSGFSTLVNKVGRHRDRKSLEAMPLDAWEAELVVAVAHYLLAYAKRSTASES